MPESLHNPRPAATLAAYSLGVVPFEATLAFQRRAHYEVTGDRAGGRLLLCEHPHAITVGRHGSRAHVRAGPEELAAWGWPVRWVARGGGVVLHAPGQLAVYPVFALDRLGLDVSQYLDRLQTCVLAVLADLGVAGRTDPDRNGVWAGGRLVAAVGVAVRDSTTTFGLWLNVAPKLDAFARVDCAGDGGPPMTSLQRELRSPVRMAAVRQRLLEAFARQFGFARLSLFHSHPAFSTRAPGDAIAPRAS
jgi:lipoyl(octanoyl) transferase